MLASRRVRVLLGAVLAVGLIGAPSLPAESVAPDASAAPAGVAGPGWLRELPAEALRSPQLGQGENWVSWPNGDGTTTARMFDRAVNYQDRSGRWLPIDTRLVADGDGSFSNHAGPISLELAAGAADANLAKVATEQGSVSLGLVGQASTSATGGLVDAADSTGLLEQAGGDSLVYRSVFPGVDLRYRLTTGALKEEIILTQPLVSGTKPEFRFSLSTAGLTAIAGPDGTISFKDAGGKVVFTIPAGLAWDSKGATTKVSYLLAAAGDAISVSVDPGWLVDPDRVFPVTIDPTINIVTNGDSFVYSADPDTNFQGWGQLDLNLVKFVDNVGYSGGTYRSYQSFDFTPLTGAHVTSAYWHGYAYAVSGTTPAAVSLRPINDPGFSGPPTWNNQPAVRTNSSGSGGYTGAGWQSAPITSWVQNWVGGTWANEGIQLRGPTANNALIQLAAAIQETEFFSYIDVVYQRDPFVPTAALANDTALRANGAIGDPTPEFSVEVADPDGGTVLAEYEIWNNGHTGSPIANGQSPYVASGLRASWTPGIALTNGTTYEYRVRAFDGTYASAWTAWGTWYTFKVDTSGPAAIPTVSSTDFTSGAWSATSTGTVTFGNGGVTDLKGYWWGLDDGDYPRNWTPLASNTATITAESGWHELVVRSQDNAGWLSAPAYFRFGVGAGGITLLEDEYETNGTVQLSVESSSSYNQARLYYQKGFEAPVLIPVADVAIAAWPIACTSCGTNPRTYQTLTWDVAATRGSVDGPISVKAEFGNSGTWTGQYSTILDLRLEEDPFQFGSNARTRLGPGTVDLVTGNYTIGAGDASTPAGGVSRFYETQGDTTTNVGAFGPGWSDSTGSFQMPYRDLVDNSTDVTITTTDGTTIVFRYNTATSSYTIAEGGAAPGEEDDGIQLTKSGANFVLTIRSFATITFATVTGEPTNTYYPISFNDDTGLDGDNVDWEFNTATGTVRPKAIASAIAADVTCTTTNAATTPGCGSVTFTYAVTTTATGSTLGDFIGHLKTVTYRAYDPGTAAMLSTDVAEYRYDDTGRLREAWDPRISPALKTAYTYQTSTPFRLLTITPPGLQTVTLAYDGSGRISTVSHPALAPATGTVTTTVRYDIPLTVAGGGPANLSSAEILRWGQTDVPTMATSVFPPDQIPSGTPPSSYTRATTIYMNAEGQVTNVVSPSGGGISTAEHDQIGNVVRSLSAGNRQRALDQGATPESEASIAFRLDSRSVFDENQTWLLLDEFGPTHTVTLDDGTLAEGREHVRHFYDDGLPASLSAYEFYNSATNRKPAAVANEPFLLETKTVVGLRLWDNTTSVDQRTTEIRYAWDMDRPTLDTIQDDEGYGWNDGQAIATVIDPAGNNLATVNAYDTTTGRPTERRLPKNASGGSATAATTKFRYYTAGQHPEGDTDCDLKPEWAGLACKSYPAAQPPGATMPTSWMTGYGYYLQPTGAQDISGVTTRTTTLGYDSAGRLNAHNVDSTNGTDIPNVTTSYNSSTGLPTTNTDGTRTITRVYDTLGRMSSYTDADSNTSTYAYDALDRPLTINDGKATTTLTYGVSDNRGFLGTISDAQAGSFGATYDTNGQLASETLPGSFTRTFTYDETGRPTQQTLTKSGTTLLTEQLRWDAHGRWAYHATSGFSNQTYEYDNASRLVTVDDIVPGTGCTTRVYGFDNNTNRTSLTTRTPPSDGTCAASGGSTATSTYDTADRATLAGYVYNNLGRTTTIPAADTPTNQDTTLGYYVNDLTRTITNNATTRTFNLDPNRRYRTIVDAAGTYTNHYTSDTDSPAWTTTNTAGTNWTRHIGGFTGLEAVVNRVSGVDTTKLQIQNLHGDIITTADTTDTTLNDPAQDTTEYGLPRDGTNTRYDYLGAYQRHNDTQSGITLMGVRNYNPASGRFASVDPVMGGNSNAYNYPAEPLTNSDLSGALSDRQGPLGWQCIGTSHFDYNLVFIHIEFTVPTTCRIYLARNWTAAIGRFIQGMGKTRSISKLCLALHDIFKADIINRVFRNIVSDVPSNVKFNHASCKDILMAPSNFYDAKEDAIRLHRCLALRVDVGEAVGEAIRGALGSGGLDVNVHDALTGHSRYYTAVIGDWNQCRDYVPDI